MVIAFVDRFLAEAKAAGIDEVVTIWLEAVDETLGIGFIASANYQHCSFLAFFLAVIFRQQDRKTCPLPQSAIDRDFALVTGNGPAAEPGDTDTGPVGPVQAYLHDFARLIRELGDASTFRTDE